MKYVTLVSFLFICCRISSYAQTYAIAGLLDKVYKAQNDREKLQAIIDLSEEYKSMNRDTLSKYAYLAQGFASKIDDKRIAGQTFLVMAYMYSRWGWVDSTVAEANKGLRINPVADSRNRDTYFKLQRQKAMVLGGALRFPQALEILYGLVTEAEKYRDTLTLSANLNTIGSIALARSKPHEALPWLARAQSLTGDNVYFVPTLAAIYVNTAEAYNQLSRKDSAQFFIAKGVALCRRYENLTSLSIALQRQSAIYLKAGKVHEAESALEEMVEVRKRLGGAGLWVDDNLALIDFYIQTNQIEKAIAFCQENLRQGHLLKSDSAGNFGVLTNNINLRLSYYEKLAACYKIQGNHALHEAMLENIIMAKDSFYEANSANAIAEFQTRYDLQKKESTIISQKYDLLKKDYLFYGFLGAFAFIVIVAGLSFRKYRQKQRLELELFRVTERYKTEHAVMEAEERERGRISRNLHDNLGAYAASLGFNVDRLASNRSEEENRASMQTLRDNAQAIVSLLNDTIWTLRKDTHTLTSIGDRAKLLISRLEPAYPHITFSFTENITRETTLSSSHAFHLFQIISEGINNAIRHSGGKDINVVLNSDHTGWGVSITDNGKGLSETVMHSHGNGLTNMRTRAGECGWEIQWLSHSPSGVVIRLTNTN